MEEKLAYTVTGVTVYPDRARVECQGSVQVTPEVDTLLFDGLPLSMEKESVTVSGKGTAPVSILSVDVGLKHYEQSPSAEIRSLEAELESVSEALQAVADDIAVWQAESDMLQSLRDAAGAYAKGFSRGRLSVDEQSSLLRFLRDQDSAVRKEQRMLRQQSAALERKLEKLENELSELRSAQPRRRNQVRVTIAAEGEGQFLPVLRYVVHNARWQPLYDLRYVDSGGGAGKLTLSAQAQITQNTGQDWENVRLSVSTARPALNQRLPDLKPWYIDVYDPPFPAPAGYDREAAGMKKQILADAVFASSAARSGEEEMVEAAPVSATIQDGNAIVNYEIAGTSTVESDGASHKYFLGHTMPQTSLNYLAVPRHTDAVFRQLKAINAGAAPLLAGQANLFYNDEFIGKTDLQYTPADGEMKLLLGIEERIEVTRELQRRDVDKKFLKDERIVHFGYEIKLKNLLAEAAAVELRDQLPLARHEQIQVRMDESTPAPSEKSKMNILQWNLSLEPDSETIVRYEYTVQHPRSMTISGLQE